MGRKLTLFKKEELAFAAYFRTLIISNCNEEWFSHVLIFKNTIDTFLGGLGVNDYRKRRALHLIIDAKPTSPLGILNTRVHIHKHHRRFDTKTAEKARALFRYGSVLCLSRSDCFGTSNLLYSDRLKTIGLADSLAFKKRAVVIGRNDTGKSK